MWWFSSIDVPLMLTQQPEDLNSQRTRWNQLKRRLANEDSDVVTSCHQLEMSTTDGKTPLADVATAETLLGFERSRPSPKAETMTLWLAMIGT